MSTRRYQPVKHESTVQVRYNLKHEDRPAERTSYDDKCIHTMREAVAQLGWSLAVHGSLVRDIDLVAVPWTDDCEPQLAVFNAFLNYGYVLFGQIAFRAHGRMAATLSGPAAKVIDLSVFPLRTSP